MAMADILSGMNTPEMWRQMLLHMQRGGVAIDPSQTYGFQDRNIAGTNKPSMHSARSPGGQPAAAALDINAGANPEGAPATYGPQPWDIYGEDARKPTRALDRATIEDVQNRFPVKNLMDRRGNPDRMHFQYDPSNPARFVQTGPASMGSFDLPSTLGVPGMGAGGMGIDPAAAFATNQRLNAPPAGGDQPIEDYQTLYPGTGAGAPIPAPEGLPPHWTDPSGAQAADLPNISGGGPGLPSMPTPGPATAYPGIDPQFPYGKPADEFKSPPASDSAASPVVTSSTGKPGGGMAPAVAGGGFVDTLRNLPRTGILGAIGNAAGIPALSAAAQGFGGMLNDPMLNSYLGYWAGGPAGASALGGAANTMAGNRFRGQELDIHRADLALRQAEGERKATTFAEDQAEYQKRQQIWKDVFGTTGVADKTKPLAKDVPDDYLATAYSVGPDAGLKMLQEYQLANAKQKLELRKMAQLQQQSLERFGMGGTPATPGAAAGAPTPPAGPTTAAPTAPFGGVGLGSTIAQPAPPTPPALAPAPPAPGTPAPAPAAPISTGGMPSEPMIQMGNVQIPLRYARAYAAADEAAGIKDGAWSKAIVDAQAPITAAATKKATMDVEQEQGKPQARLAATNMADSLNATETLANKIRNDPRLKYATGNWSSTQIGPSGAVEQRPFGSLRLSADTRATEADMGTLIAKVGLDTLRSMREGSKSGSSGLGGTSDNEINMLSNALTALKDPSISTAAYKQNLQTVIDVVRSVRSRLESTWKETYKEDFKPAGELTKYQTKSVAQERKEAAKEKMQKGAWKVEEVK